MDLSQGSRGEARRQEFGDAVRVFRRLRGLSQQELADQAGIDRKTVLRIEHGHYSPALDRVWALADALGVTAAELLMLGESLARRVVPPTGGPEPSRTDRSL